MKLLNVEQIAEPLLDELKRVESVEQAVIAGSYRRRKETVRDLDTLVACTDAKKVMDRFVSYEEVSEVISHGTTRSAVRLRPGLQVDVRVVPVRAMARPSTTSRAPRRTTSQCVGSA